MHLQNGVSPMGPNCGQSFSQLSGIANSTDGTNFAVSNDQALCLSYLRGFQWNKRWYGLTARALVYRSTKSSWPNGKEPFEERAEPLGSWRHCAVHLESDRLFVFYTRWGDAPERMVASYIDLKMDWNDWVLSPPVAVLRPEGEAEGAHLPTRPSKKGLPIRRCMKFVTPICLKKMVSFGCIIALPENRASLSLRWLTIGKSSLSSVVRMVLLITPIRINMGLQKMLKGKEMTATVELTADERQAYFDDGFLVKRQVFTSKEVQQMLTGFGTIWDLAEELRPSEPGRVVIEYEGSRFTYENRSLRFIAWCGKCLSTLAQFGSDARLRAIAAQLLGTNKLEQLINQAHYKDLVIVWPFHGIKTVITVVWVTAALSTSMARVAMFK